MNKLNLYIIVAVVVVVIIAMGGYVFMNSKQGEVETTDNQPVAQSHRSYEVIPVKPSQVIPGQPAKISYQIKNDQGKILKNFSVVHEKIMHFIVVRKDLQNFQHLHPEFDSSTGTFSIDMNFPTDGPYTLFADFTPAKEEDNPQQLPVTESFELTAGDLNNYQPQALTVDAQKNKKVDDYNIEFGFPETINSQSSTTYTLNVNKAGKPVEELETYLGALGHSVILKEQTLLFIHAHTEEISVNPNDSTMGHSMSPAGSPSTAKGPEIKFTTTFPEPGVYKIFTQFQHMGKVQTTDYVVQAN